MFTASDLSTLKTRDYVNGAKLKISLANTRIWLEADSTIYVEKWNPISQTWQHFSTYDSKGWPNGWTKNDRED